MPEDLNTAIPVDAWTTTTAAPVVEPHELHLWCARAPAGDARVAELARALPPEESERAARLARSAARSCYVAGRTLLRRALGDVLRQPPATIRLAYSPAGKPRIAAAAPVELHFSLSHADDVVLVALTSRVEVGIDVEPVRVVRAADRIARRFFTATTAGVLERLPADERALAFLHAWTQREAVVKVVDEKLFTSVELLGFVWPKPARVVVQRPVGSAEMWSVVTPDIGSSWIATAVAAGRLTRVRQWQVEL